MTLFSQPRIKLKFHFLSQVFIKSELKVGVIYVKEGQYNEEEILDNNDNSPLFEEFLKILGDTVVLKGKCSDDYRMPGNNRIRRKIYFFKRFFSKPKKRCNL